MLFTNRNPHVRDGCILIDNNNYNDDYLLALKSPIVHVNNQPTPKVKFLGVFLDPNLNFCLHNKTISAKISNSVYHLRAGKKYTFTKGSHYTLLFFNTFPFNLCYTGLDLYFKEQH
jgi:hypothetical protein